MPSRRNDGTAEGLWHLATRFEDIWTSRQPLPDGRQLALLARRLASIWDASGIVGKLRIVYNPALRTTAGRALLNRGIVELNARLLNTNRDQLLGTLAHELAHFVVHERFGRLATPHGPQFRRLMKEAGLSGRARHHLSAGCLARRRFLYMHRCDGCGDSFIARSVRRNVCCRRCGPGLTWSIFRAPATEQGLSALQGLSAGGQATT